MERENLHIGGEKADSVLKFMVLKSKGSLRILIWGNVISNDEQNSKNRISKRLGIITGIMNILESVTLGVHYFSTAILLRES